MHGRNDNREVQKIKDRFKLFDEELLSKLILSTALPFSLYPPMSKPYTQYRGFVLHNILL